MLESGLHPQPSEFPRWRPKSRTCFRNTAQVALILRGLGAVLHRAWEPSRCSVNADRGDQRTTVLGVHWGWGGGDRAGGTQALCGDRRGGGLPASAPPQPRQHHTQPPLPWATGQLRGVGGGVGRCGLPVSYLTHRVLFLNPSGNVSSIQRGILACTRPGPADTS